MKGVWVLDGLGEPVFDNAKLSPIFLDSKRITLCYQQFVMALQNKLVDLRMNIFPLRYSKALHVKSKKMYFLSIFAEGLRFLIGESTKI